MSLADREEQLEGPPAAAGASAETESDIISDQESLPGQFASAYGHPYYCAGPFTLPFDETEQRRLDSLHRLLRLCLDGDLTVTRIPPDVKMIVDIGTGTGRWAIEMAARYPGATIIGVDIAPIQAKPVPENVRFEIADVEKPWTIDPSSVDFIHVRALAGMIRNWPSLISEAFGKLKPGGLLEITDVRGRVLDFDGKFGEDEITPNLTRLFQQLATSLGTIFDPAPEMPGWLHDEGFEKVAQQTEIIPLGRWAKDKKLRARQKQATAMVLPWFRTFTCPFGMIQSVSAGFPPGSHTHSIRKHGEADPQKENHATNLSANHEEVRADTDAEIERVIRDISDANVKTYVQAVFTTARKPRKE